MEISTKEVYLSKINRHISIQFPRTCPCCGIANNPTTYEIAHVDTFEGAVVGLFHRCPACEESHMTLQDCKKEENYATMVSVYPNKVVANIDPLLIEHAPNFTDIYSQALQAEKHGLERIAGMGYRLSIECLIKDYALDFELATPEDISKQNLNNAIDKFMKEDELLKNTIHTVRKIGNDYAHWKKEYDIPLHVLKSYVDITAQSFKIKFMMKYPPI